MTGCPVTFLIQNNTAMKKIDPKELKPNVIELISDRWMLVTAGAPDNFNTMTASWGAVGELWGKPVAFVFIRPQRYTHEFVEKNDMLTLSFFAEEYRSALKFCGAHSGRDTDKAAKTGLTPAPTESGSTTFAEADIVLECRKLYKDEIKPESFTDKTIIDKWYPARDFHSAYVVEIVNAWIAE